MITIDVKNTGVKRDGDNLIIDINKITRYETYPCIDKTRVQANSGNRASIFTNQCITCKYNSKMIVKCIKIVNIVQIKQMTVAIVYVVHL